jgi:hypothetical protein
VPQHAKICVRPRGYRALYPFRLSKKSGAATWGVADAARASRFTVTMAVLTLSTMSILPAVRSGPSGRGARGAKTPEEWLSAHAAISARSPCPEKWPANIRGSSGRHPPSGWRP